MILANLLSIFLMISQASGEPAKKPVDKSSAKPTCDSNAVTRNCDFFRERSSQKEIKLPDGSTIDNPLYDYSKSLPNQGGGGMVNGYNGGLYTGVDYDKTLYNQAEVIDAMEETSFSTRFKMTYASLASSLVSFPNLVQEIPWPPTDKDAKKQSMKPAEIEAYLKKNMSEDEYAHLQEVIKVQATPLQVQMQAQMSVQQKAMADDKKRVEAGQLMTDPRAKKKLRIKELFLYTKEQVSAMIRRGKKDSELTSEEKALIAKVQSIELTDPDSPEVVSSSNCSGGISNAFYSPEKHTLNVCPGKVMKSDADLVSAMAHEIAHSIDPCNARMPLWEVEQEKFKIFMSDPSLSAEDKAYLQKRFPLGTKMINWDLDLSFNNLKISKSLIEKGVFKKVQDGVSQEKYPFKQEYNCFVKENFFRENSAKDIATTKDYFSKHMHAEPENKVVAKKSADRYFMALDKYPQCLRTMAPSSQMQETMADMVRSVVLEKYILDNPFKSEEEKVASVPFAAQTCSLNTVKPEKPDSISPWEVQSIFSSETYSDPHPQDSERVKKIILNLPGMAKIYDCQRKVPACFDHLSFSTRMTSTAPPLNDSGLKMEKGEK